jgi:N-acetylglucosaminyl-diphospho-decaprenol L-rhamnosyltransferase
LNVVSSPILDVVIVAYRSRELLRRCLASLREFPASGGMTVRVIDNASGDGTVEMVRRCFPEAHLVPAARNLGFSAASNIGIRRSGAPFVLCLNPDTRVTESALDDLLELMTAHPEIGICGCRLQLEDGTLDHAAKRSFPTPLSSLGHFLAVGRLRSSGPLAAYRAPEISRGPVDAVNGAFMLCRRSALDRVGLFDEGFWMYMEDRDLCYRFARAGWVTWYEPTVSVIHVKAGTSGPLRSPRLNYAFHYGMYRFYRKHYARHRSRLTNALIYCGIVVKLAASVVRNAIVATGRSMRAMRGFALTSARAR